MNYDKGFGFIAGLVIGGLVGATVAILLAPASGEATREQIRAESIALKQRGQEFGNDRVHDAQNMVKQGKRGVSDAQTSLGREIEDQKDNLQVAMGK